MTDPQLKAIATLRHGWRVKYGIRWVDRYDPRADESLIITLETLKVDHVYVLCPAGLLKVKTTLIKDPA